jgi:hypothetical protein
MGLILNRLTDLIGESASFSAENAHYQAAINEAIKRLPDEELMENSLAPITLNNSTTTWTLPGEVKILNVLRLDANSSGIYRSASKVDWVTFQQSKNTNSLARATKLTPAYAINPEGSNTQVLNVEPTPEATQVAKIWYAKFQEDTERIVDDSGLWNGDFTANNQNWTAGTGHTADTTDNRLELASAATDSETFYYKSPLTASTKYILSWEIPSYTAGDVKFQLGADGAVSANQRVSGEITLSTGSSPGSAKELRIIAVGGGGTVTLNLDNIRLRRADSSADIATDDTVPGIPELAQQSVIIKTGINILSNKISDAVQDEEDAEILQLIQAQHQHLTQMFQQELQLASEEGGS